MMQMFSVDRDGLYIQNGIKYCKYKEGYRVLKKQKIERRIVAFS